MVQVDLITGFLGAGKTTFLRRYVRYLVQQGHKVCILENDFGAVNVDAMLVQELHNQATIHETVQRFDRMIHAFVMLMMPHIDRSEREISLVATGLNGYVTQIAIRWVMSGYRQPMQEVLSSCSIVFLSLLQTFAKNGQSAKSK